MWPLRNPWLLAAILVAAVPTLGAFSIAIIIYPPNLGPPPIIAALPIAGLKASDLHESFNEIRHGHRHEAIDIMKPYGTPVHAVVDGTIRKLFVSRAGGTTIYQFDTNGKHCYYYAHLDRYADALYEGMSVERGQILGYVGTSGNAAPGAPQSHLAILRLGSDKRWWEGMPIDPYPVLLSFLEKSSGKGAHAVMTNLQVASPPTALQESRDHKGVPLWRAIYPVGTLRVFLLPVLFSLCLDSRLKGP